MSFTNKQAAALTLATGSNTIYSPLSDSQIRAFTVHNPTAAPILLTVAVNGLALIDKTLAEGATEVLSTLFNQQLKKEDLLTMTGEGLNVMLTVVEITG